MELNFHKRIIPAILILCISALFVVLIPYVYHFYGGVSNAQADWAQFGDYIGGTLNPLLSFITVLILLFTLKMSYDNLDLTKKELELTQIELKESRKIARAQVRHFKNEAVKSDLFDVIKSVDMEIQEIFTRIADFSKTDSNPDGNNFGYYFSRSATSTSLKDIPIHREYAFTTHDRVALCNLIEALQNLESFMNQYETTFGPSAKTFYYKSKNGNVFSRLRDRNFIVEEDFTAFRSIGYSWSAQIKRPKDT